jgi:hypothetical protein
MRLVGLPKKDNLSCSGAFLLRRVAPNNVPDLFFLAASKGEGGGTDEGGERNKQREGAGGNHGANRGKGGEWGPSRGRRLAGIGTKGGERGTKQREGLVGIRAKGGEGRGAKGSGRGGGKERGEGAPYLLSYKRG